MEVVMLSSCVAIKRETVINDSHCHMYTEA